MVFPSLSDPICGTLCKKGFCDVVEHGHTDEKAFGVVFYGVRMNIMLYYRLGVKYPTAHFTLDNLGQFVSEYGIPKNFKTDSHNILDAGGLWKRVPGAYLPPMLYV